MDKVKTKRLVLFLLAVAFFPVVSTTSSLAEGKFFIGWYRTSPYASQRFLPPSQYVWHRPFPFCPYAHYYSFTKSCFVPYVFYQPGGSTQSPENHLNFEIHPAGQLLISVKPSGALVLVDGHALCRQENKSPVEVGLLVGRHWVEIKKEGYIPYLKEVEIMTNKRDFLIITLEKEGG